jgi:hypothetical protein
MRCAALLLAAALAPAPASAETRAWDFRVLLDGREIGRHQFTLRGAGEERELTSEARFAVELLSFTAWRYRHEATERWRGPCLQSLASRTQTNARTETVRAGTRDGRLVVERDGTVEWHDGCVMTFAYWDPRILGARRLLNSQTGRLHDVRVAAIGEEMLDVRGRRLRALRHRIEAPDLSIDLWFADGEWVALESKVRGARRLRYELL